MDTGYPRVRGHWRVSINTNDDACLCISLRQAALAVTQIYDEAPGSSGLKITMFRLLRRISEAGKPTINELARSLDLDRSTGRNLRVLQRMGYVKLAGGRDERSKLVSLTTGGKARLETALDGGRSAIAVT
jgi:DNA-binding MarR family transcriptional regulator